MSFSDRRRDGGEGRGVEGKYRPWAVIGADFEARCRSSRQPELKSSSGTHPFKNLKHDLSCFPVTKLTLSKHWIFLHNVKTKLSVNIGLQHCHITYVNKREHPLGKITTQPKCKLMSATKKIGADRSSTFRVIVKVLHIYTYVHTELVDTISLASPTESGNNYNKIPSQHMHFWNHKLSSLTNYTHHQWVPQGPSTCSSWSRRSRIKHTATVKQLMKQSGKYVTFR